MNHHHRYSFTILWIAFSWLSLHQLTSLFLRVDAWVPPQTRIFRSSVSQNVAAMTRQSATTKTRQRCYHPKESSSTTSLSLSSNGDGIDNPEELKAKAMQIRLQAKLMEDRLLQEKIASLKEQVQKDPSKQELLDDLELRVQRKELMERISEKEDVLKKKQKEVVVVEGVEEASEQQEEEVQLQAELQELKDQLQELAPAPLTTTTGTDEEEEVLELQDLLNIVEETKEYVDELTDQDQELISEFKGYLEGFKNFTGDIEFADADYSESDLDMDIENLIANVTSGNITKEELENIRMAKGVFDFGTQLLDGMAGMTGKSREELMKVVKVEIKKTNEYQKEDPLYEERMEAFLAKFEQTLFEGTLEQEEAMQFCEEILDAQLSQAFRRKEKPIRLRNAFLVKGEVKAQNGDELLSQIQTALQSSSLASKIDVFYIADPSSQLELDDVEMADMVQGEDLMESIQNIANINPPALLLTPKEKKEAEGVGSLDDSNEPPLDLIFLGVAAVSLANFCGIGYHPQNDEFFSNLVTGVTHPTTILAVLGTVFIKQFATFAVAAINGFSIGWLPQVMPGTFGFGATSPSFKSSPKSNNDLFAATFAGSIAGLGSSLALLTTGLITTLSLNSAEISQLPRLDLETIHLSYFISAFIETVMGTDVLLSLDPTSSNIPCHPLTIAGFIGVMFHSLSIVMPAKRLDGDRMSKAVFGRFDLYYNLAQVAASFFLLVTAFRNFETSTYMAWAIGFAGAFFDNEPDVACRNDVDRASSEKIVLLAVTVLFACLCLSPA